MLNLLSWLGSAELPPTIEKRSMASQHRVNSSYISSYYMEYELVGFVVFGVLWGVGEEWSL